MTKYFTWGEFDKSVDYIANQCKKLKDETNCPNEQVVALLSVIASNFAPIIENNN